MCFLCKDELEVCDDVEWMCCVIIILDCKMEWECLLGFLEEYLLLWEYMGEFINVFEKCLEEKLLNMKVVS